MAWLTTLEKHIATRSTDTLVVSIILLIKDIGSGTANTALGLRLGDLSLFAIS